MAKWLIFIILITTSCIDFEFEAPYEDLNGIYLEHILSRDDIHGWKLLCEEDKSYISSGHLLTGYSFAQVDSIYELGAYTAIDFIADFDIADGFAYIVSHSGLEIVDFQQTEPHLTGILEIGGGFNKVRKDNDRTCMTQDDNYYIIDVSDKGDPRIVGEFDFGNTSNPIIWFEVDSNVAHILFNSSDFCLLDISDPTNMNIVSQVSVYDTLGGSAKMFALKDDYLYFLKDNYLETYQQSDNGDLQYISSTGFASSAMLFIYVGEKYGLACSEGSWVYLLNLEYASRPCITEIFDLGWPQRYGITRDNYIYLLTPYLEILEIKEVQ